MGHLLARNIACMSGTQGYCSQKARIALALGVAWYPVAKSRTSARGPPHSGSRADSQSNGHSSVLSSTIMSPTCNTQPYSRDIIQR